jgi:hypothetical protein
VVDLQGQEVVIKPDYDHGLVDLVEATIARIKSGDVIGIGLIELHTDPDDDITTSYQGRRLSLLAGASRMVHHLNTALDAYVVRE